MRALDYIKKVAAKVKLVNVVEKLEAELPPVDDYKTISVTLAELAGSRSKPKSGASGTASELAVSLESLYETLKLKPPVHGWTVEKVLATLASEKFKKTNKMEIRMELKQAMAESKVPADIVGEDIIREAMSKDRLLDQYEKYAFEKFRQRKQERKNATISMEDKVKECQDQIKRLKEEQEKDSFEFKNWIDKKIAAEDQLVAAVTHLTFEPKITKGCVTKDEE